MIHGLTGHNVGLDSKIFRQPGKSKSIAIAYRLPFYQGTISCIVIIRIISGCIASSVIIGTFRNQVIMKQQDLFQIIVSCLHNLPGSCSSCVKLLNSSFDRRLIRLRKASILRRGRFTKMLTVSDADFLHLSGRLRSSYFIISRNIKMLSADCCLISLIHDSLPIQPILSISFFVQFKSGNIHSVSIVGEGSCKLRP